MEKAKRIPYGVSDFVDIIERNQYYVDKTMYLPMIEDEADSLFFIRPRRFGKSLLISMMRASDFYREVFKGMFSRIFMTGVSPVTLDDLTSGFNIGWHISTKAAFNQMLGFSTEDVYAMVDYYKQTGRIRPDADTDAIVADMKPWYDNYCFSKNALRTQSRVFNCDMVMYYLRNYMSDGEPPKQMLAPNTKTDYAKMKKLLQLDRLDGDRKGVLMTIAERGEILGNIAESFPAKALTDPKIFVSLLFYYGMLTIKDTFGDQLLLGIPNNNVRKQYYEYLRRCAKAHNCTR